MTITLTRFEPLPKKAADHRLTVNLTEGEYRELAQLAHRAQASQSQLGKLAIKQLLLHSDTMLPSLPKADCDDEPAIQRRSFSYGGLA